MQWIIEDIPLIIIEHLLVNQVLALNYPQGVDLLLNYTKQKVVKKKLFGVVLVV